MAEKRSRIYSAHTLQSGLDFSSDAGDLNNISELDDMPVAKRQKLNEDDSKTDNKAVSESIKSEKPSSGTLGNKTNDNAQSSSDTEQDMESNDIECVSANTDNITDTKIRSVNDEMNLLNGESPMHHEYEIIDDAGSENENDMSGDSDSDEDEWDEEDIDAMLEEGLRKKDTGTKDGNEQPGPSSDTTTANEEEFEPPEQREKVVLLEKGHDPFEVLPEGWVQVTHNSGMPVYLHKASRVVTMSKPYFLGTGSARKHDVPVSAIPCFHYKKAIQKEMETVEEDEQTPTEEANGAESSDTSNVSKLPAEALKAKVQSLGERQKDLSLDHLAIREYCQKLFTFKTITVKKFKTWKDRRKFHVSRNKSARPSLPENTKLITCPVLPTFKDERSNKKKQYFINPHGKSPISILHEYVQHSLHTQPKYIFTETENAVSPYRATVTINELPYGSGVATSKKAAKMEAAKQTLVILIPEMSKMEDEGIGKTLTDVSFFDEIKVDDPRVYDLSNMAGQPCPYQILQECLKRHQDLAAYCKLDMSMKSLKHHKSEFTITVGKHSATVVCKNKREGKQQASQAILKLLHPHITSWGSLLRLYACMTHTLKEQKEKLESITKLSQRAKVSKVNAPLLEKLKTEMRALAANSKTLKSKGKLHVSDVPDLPSASANQVTSVDFN